MKSKISPRIATAMFFAAISTGELFPQHLKYSGDVEADVVASREFAAAQIGISSTHGAYFVKPQMFVGVGASIMWNIDAEFWNNVYPVYGDIRKDFNINRFFLAFVDAKAGYTFQGNSTGMIGNCGIDYGFYLYPSVGLRVRTSDRCGIYLKIGYTYQHTIFSYFIIGPGIIHEGNRKYNTGGFSASLGFSF